MSTYSHPTLERLARRKLWQRRAIVPRGEINVEKIAKVIFWLYGAILIGGSIYIVESFVSGLTPVVTANPFSLAGLLVVAICVMLVSGFVLVANAIMAGAAGATLLMLSFIFERFGLGADDQVTEGMGNVFWRMLGRGKEPSGRAIEALAAACKTHPELAQVAGAWLAQREQGILDSMDIACLLRAARKIRKQLPQ